MDCLGNQIWQSQGGHYLSPSSELVQSTHCQTKIGIGVLQRIKNSAIGLILESEVTVIVDQYQCVKTDVSISEV